MLEHQELQSEDDPPDGSHYKPSHNAPYPNDSPQFVSGPSYPPQPPAAQAKPDKDLDAWWKDRKFILELLAFIVLLAYTWFAGLQWLQIKWTNKLTREALNGNNFSLQQTLDKMQWQIQISDELAKQALTQSGRITQIAGSTGSLAGAAQKSLILHDSDRRPYVLSKEMGTLKLSAGKVIQANMEMVNWGQSLAKDVDMDAGIWFGDKAEQSADKFFTNPINHSEATGFFLIPSIGVGDPKSPSFQYTTISSAKQAPSAEAIAFIQSHDGGVVIAGRIRYRDNLGTSYRTDFCFKTLISGMLASCEKHNEIH